MLRTNCLAYRLVCWLLSGYLLSLTCSDTPLFAEDVPHAQDKPPGPPLSPDEAVRKMTVPPGFSVEIVASEPDIVNPVAMSIDERGRFWITESVEYPRRSPGPGKDRVKILEDTDGDGRIDKVSLFAEGLNIPSGIAVGHGGVWVANAPDLLFMQDSDGDGRVDRQEVVVTGFGRADTHELPNSLTWGPDGWLYGLNGVFNHSHVKYPESSPHFKPDHPGWPITCALFRVHPQTRKFEVFCEGTSNPWGVAFDREGSAFISACVIDHLWHLVQSGYYHRQGGPYPPFTWKIESIVKHKHQKAAYCGIHYFDSAAYPPEYRGRLYMGNIHGGCLNVDVLRRNGATYAGAGEPDFLTANDAWFMPVVQKTGPDGCLYILDWYDRYHCYQDANRDPAGLDRLKGRLYRVRYQATPRAPQLDLAAETDVQLLARLGTHNDFIQSTAQRILTERLLAGSADYATALSQKLLALVGRTETVESAAGPQRRALFLLCSQRRLESAIHWELLNHPDPIVRAWGVRATNTLEQLDDKIRTRSADLARDSSRDVQLQVAIAATKLAPEQPAELLLNVLAHCEDDPIIPQIVWQNLHPRLDQHATSLLADIARRTPPERANIELILPRLCERLLAAKMIDSATVTQLFTLLIRDKLASDKTTQQCLSALTTRVQTREISGANLEALKHDLQPIFQSMLMETRRNRTDLSQVPLAMSAALLLTSWGDTTGLDVVRQALASPDYPESDRLRSLDALIAIQDPGLLDQAIRILSAKTTGPINKPVPPAEDSQSAKQNNRALAFRGQLVAALGRLGAPEVAERTLQIYPQLDPELQPRVVELLTQRVDWSMSLLTAIGNKTVPATALNANQVRKLLATRHAPLVKQVTAIWGTVRDERNPQRELVIAEMRRVLRQSTGNPHAGQKIFAKVCGQCHKIYGEGAEVGPDITLNGRSSFEQLLSNVFDPSLVIGASYQARTIVTTEGRVLTGLVTEDNDQRVVLKVQGGKVETIPRAQIEESRLSALSMMPEDLEKQLSRQELIDLFAFITLDRPPSDPQARRLAGVDGVVPRQTTDAAQFNELVGEIAPGFTIAESGEGGVALLSEYRGRRGVLRTHPVSRDKACVLTRIADLPADKKSRLIVDVTHDPRGDWRLIIAGNGGRLTDEMISAKTVKTTGWTTFEVDLSRFAGQQVRLQLINQANDWNYEFGYWGRVDLISE